MSASAAVSVTTDVWTSVAAMPTSRVAGASITTLPGGGVLVIGGVGDGAIGTAAVDLFSPVMMGWQPAGSRAAMTMARTSATLLVDGRVFVCGGSTLTGAVAAGYVNTASAEIYDPVANTWAPAASISVARSHHTATLLPDGKVLVAGGEDARYQVGATAEIFDPLAATWRPAALPMNSARSQHTATLLPGGLELIAGGFDIVAGKLTPLATAELYDPAVQAFAPATSTKVPHSGHTATLLPDGRVLVAAGGNARAEIYDPATKLWFVTAVMNASRTAAGATLLSNGQLLAAGGTRSAPDAERYDPAADTWEAAASMSVSRDAPIATSLPDGSPLVCGGAQDAGSTSCEIYWCADAGGIAARPSVRWKRRPRGARRPCGCLRLQEPGRRGPCLT